MMLQHRVDSVAGLSYIIVEMQHQRLCLLDYSRYYQEAHHEEHDHKRQAHHGHADPPRSPPACKPVHHGIQQERQGERDRERGQDIQHGDAHVVIEKYEELSARPKRHCKRRDYEDPRITTVCHESSPEGKGC